MNCTAEKYLQYYAARTKAVEPPTHVPVVELDPK